MFSFVMKNRPRLDEAGLRPERWSRCRHPAVRAPASKNAKALCGLLSIYRGSGQEMTGFYRPDLDCLANLIH